MNKAKYDVFISYATEDSVLASEIAGGLMSRGIKVWYSELELKVGDKLLDRIEQGMRDSNFGILLISPLYLKKGWTNYEMDVLIRQSIEANKKLLPIWHQVTKEEVDERHSGLAGIYALQSTIGFHKLIPELTGVIAEGVSSILLTPSYESSRFRFLQGRGELLCRTNDGPATTLWEFLIHSKENEYPVAIDGELYSKEDLLYHAAQIMGADPSVPKKWLNDEEFEQVWKMCLDADINPEIFG